MKNITSKKNKKIVVAFFFESLGSWEGEKNYLRSLLTAINEYHDNFVRVKVISSKKICNKLKKIKLKNIEIIDSRLFSEAGFLNLFRKIIGRILKKYDPIILYFIKKYKIDIISHYKPSYYCKTICWTPDFQHINYPMNFSNKEITRRNNLYNNIVENSSVVLLSSNSSVQDLKKFTYKKINYKKLNFVPNLDFNYLKKKNLNKYKVKNYFLVPNQFWKHKNHLVLIKAVNKLKSNNTKFKIIFTGDKKSQTDQSVYKNIMYEIKKKKLQRFFLYLGKIPYSNLINLMYRSKALINPSFFEGWSTSVEEAKILNRKVLLSDIKVHREQKPVKSYFFNPYNHVELSKIILKVIKQKDTNKSLKILKKRYLFYRAKFAREYFNIIKYTYKI